ncbi:MAG TPA: FAD-dependent monooxygenase [Kofleriaceae bacterium]|nr:FAD-dependent monooxygenase [Kofleriaceae bacterium]
MIGADGRHSVVAEAVQPAHYHERPPLLCPYYAYWTGLPMHGRFETYIRDRRGFAAVETHDGITIVMGGWPYAEFATNKDDLEASYLALFDLAPAFAARIRAATRVSKIIGMPTPNFFRTPYGPGWVLVGDAGYLKDPITAQGILDAFRDAEAVASALDDVLAGRRSFDAALGAYQRERDARVMPMYELTCQFATLEPPPPPMQMLLGAVHGNTAAMNEFCRMQAGITSPAEFFAEANVARIMSAKASPMSSAPAAATT